MGYSHHWSRPRKVPGWKFNRSVAECWRVSKYVTDELGIALVSEFDEPGSKPAFERYAIRFNGPGEPGEGQGGETFLVPAFDPDLGGYCKTFRNEYDLMVCCSLIILNHHLGRQFRVGSDGGNDDENWVKARRLCQDLLGYGGDFWLEPKGVKVRGLTGVTGKPEPGGFWDFGWGIAAHRDCSRPMKKRWAVIDRYRRSGDEPLWYGPTYAGARWGATCHLLLMSVPDHCRTPTVVAVLESARHTPKDWGGIYSVTDEIEDQDAEAAREFRWRLPTVFSK